MTILNAAAMADARVIGYRANGQPIWLHSGADNWSGMFAEPDGPDDNAADDESEEEDEDLDDDAADQTTPSYVPPSQEEWERVQAAVKRNNEENKRHRLLRKSLETRGIDLSTEDGRTALEDLLNGRTSPETGAQDQNTAKRDAQRQVERAVARTEARYKPALARSAAQAALTTAGWSGTATELTRALKMIDLDEVDVDSDGNVTGIADQVEAMKADIPSWFKADEKPAAERRRGAAEVDGGDRQTKTAAAPNWLERVDRQMTGAR